MEVRKEEKRKRILNKYWINIEIIHERILDNPSNDKVLSTN